MLKNAKDQPVNSEPQSENDVNNEPNHHMFRMEFASIPDESDPDAKPKLSISRFSICDEKLPGIEIHVWVSVDPECFDVSRTSYVECEYSFGGEFTINHNYLFDKINTEKFYRSLNKNLDRIAISEIIKEKFSGPAGVDALVAYCKEKSIEYKYTTSSYE